MHEGLSTEQLQKADLSRTPNRANRLWHMDLFEFVPEVTAMYMVQPAGKGLDDTLFARYVNGAVIQREGVFL